MSRATISVAYTPSCWYVHIFFRSVFFGRYVRKGVRVQINLDTINLLGFPEKIENRTVTFLQGRVVGGFFVCKHVAKLWVGGSLCKYGFVQIYRFCQKWPQIFINVSPNKGVSPGANICPVGFHQMQIFINMSGVAEWVGGCLGEVQKRDETWDTCDHLSSS